MNMLLKYLKKFKNVRIAVVGDMMLDKFIWGEVKRISPEAPVQVVNVKKETYLAGGGANVSANIGCFSPNTKVIGLMGKDNTKNILFKILKKYKVDTRGIIIDPKKPTVKKTRILAQNQQLLRIDYEKPEYANKKDEEKMLSSFMKSINNTDAVIISDYAKGTITESLIRKIIRDSKKKNIPVIIDPKPKHVSYYSDSFLITPNHKEACEMLGKEINNDESILDIGRELVKKTGANILITRGEKGMSLFTLEDVVIHIPTKAKEVYDVTGAGDTVIALLALSLGAGAKLEEAAEIANHGAGIVVGKVGTATLTIDELRRSLEDA